ncbi:MAG: HEAT repeat domain-containing protein [Candidatus Anammoximicrobium sp.]|nr:HEAT repeat domain-containing protein [Candidatus Anammoximicrobium sp.]
MKSAFLMSWMVGWLLAATPAPAAEATVDVQELVAELGGPDRDASLQAIGQLEALGEKALPAVPALIGKLSDDKAEVRGYAAYALGRIGDGSDAVLEGLSQAAFDRAAVVRRAALRALQRLNPPQEKALPLVLKILELGDPASIAPALQTLAEMGEAALPRLCQALTHDQACYWACLALAELGPQAAAAVPHLKGVLQHREPEVRMQALAALGEIGPAAQPLVPEIVAALKDEAGGVRYAAAFALGRVGTTPEATAALQQALQQDDAFLRMVSAWAIARNHPADRAAVERAVELILQAFKSQDVHLRRAAARIAVDVGVPIDKVAPLLVEALRDRDPEVVGNAIEALSQLGPKALQHIDEVLSNRELRPYAVRLIQRMGAKAESAVPSLVRLLGEPAEAEEEVLFKREVQFALAAIGPAAADAVPALVGSLSSEQTPICASAALALGRIGPAARAAVPALRENLRRPDPVVRLTSIRALLQIQPGEARLAVVAAPLLKEALGSEFELVRAEAAAALGERSDFGKRFIPELKKLLQDPSRLVRDRAADALKRLGE